VLAQAFLSGDASLVGVALVYERVNAAPTVNGLNVAIRRAFTQLAPERVHGVY
jgi:hypothetical protein